jgi:hypothetical protein
MTEMAGSLRTVARRQEANVSLHVDQDDDMYDDLEDLTSSKILVEALQYWKEIADPYWTANFSAKRFQKRHKLIVDVALWFGTIAIIFAILQLPLLYSPQLAKSWFIVAEFTAALATGIFVFWGVKSAVHHEWLLERHKAEQFRFLKYRSLLELAELSARDSELNDWKESLRKRIHKIEDLTKARVRRWLGENKASHEPVRPLHSVFSDKDFKKLVEYYRRKRLDVQINYFFEKAEKELERDWVTRLLLPLFFLLGIACACGHFIVDLVVTFLERSHVALDVTWQHPVSVGLIEAAAIFPVVGSAIRTYRGAHESSRNTTRFRAAFVELGRLGERLQMETLPEAILGHLRRSEEILEVEHRDWLRLMTEAEWFG